MDTTPEVDGDNVSSCLYRRQVRNPWLHCLEILETNQNNQSPLQVPVQTILLVHVHHHVHLPTLSQSTKATKIMVNLN